MTATLVSIGVTHLMFMIIYIIIVMFACDDYTKKEKTLRARLTLLAPVWELPALYFLWVGLKTMWKEADINLSKFVEKDKEKK